MAAKRRRRAQGRPQGGSDAIVRSILDATLAELEGRGFGELRVEEIARAAGVNKTSVYRRWPSKGELVLAALASAPDEEPSFVETGELRRDLVALMTAKAAQFSVPRNRKILRALVAFDPDDVTLPGVARYAKPRALIERAIERGDLPKGSDAGFLTELLLGPIVHRVLVLNEPVSAAFLDKLVDHVLAGLAVSERSTQH